LHNFFSFALPTHSFLNLIYFCTLLNFLQSFSLHLHFLTLRPKNENSKKKQKMKKKIFACDLHMVLEDLQQVTCNLTKITNFMVSWRGKTCLPLVEAFCFYFCIMFVITTHEYNTKSWCFPNFTTTLINLTYLHHLLGISIICQQHNGQGYRGNNKYWMGVLKLNLGHIWTLIMDKWIHSKMLKFQTCLRYKIWFKYDFS